MAKLKPCPFCGGEGKLKKGFPSQQRTGQRMAFVQCSKCQAKTATFYQMAFEKWDGVIDQAIAAWNERAADAKEMVRCQACVYRSQYADENGLYKCGAIQDEDGHCIKVAPQFSCLAGLNGW